MAAAAASLALLLPAQAQFWDWGGRPQRQQQYYNNNNNNWFGGQGGWFGQDRRYQERDKLQSDSTEIEWPVPYWHMDIGCAVMIVLLAAVDTGLAAAFAGAHDLDALRAVLNIPAEVIPVGVIPIGHPAPDTPSPSLLRGRKPDTEYIHREEW